MTELYPNDHAEPTTTSVHSVRLLLLISVAGEAEEKLAVEAAMRR